MIDEKDLPGGWKVFTLGKVCKLKNGFAFKSTDYVSDGVPVIRISDIKEGVVTSKKSVKVYPDNEYENYLIANNDILVAMSGATTGKFGIFRSNEIAYQNQRVGKFQILDNKVLNNEFLLYQLHSLKRQIEKDAYGGAQPNISSTKIEQMEIVVPSLNQQQAIVSKIEELFSELDKGIENLKIAQQQLKVYRQAVLKWAFEGKLNNSDVREGELPQGWKPSTIGDLFDVFIGSTPSRKEPQYWNGNINWVSSGEVSFCDINSTKEKISDEGLANSSCKVHPPGTVVMAMIGEGKTRGQAALLKIAASHNQNTAAIRTSRDNYLPKLLYYFLFFKYEANRKIGSGNNQKALNKERVKEIAIPLIPKNQQHAILQEIESRLSVCDNIEKTIIDSLQQAEALRQSILKKAFEGKLVKAEVVPLSKPKNTYFYQMQLLGIVAAASKERGISHGEMTLAKYAYLLDKVYQIPTYYEYKRWHLGPYPPEIKKAINNSKFFTKKDKAIAVKDIDTLTKYTNPYIDQLKIGINDLSDIFLVYNAKERSCQIELLATVCKVVEDIQSTDLKAVRESMADWKIDLATTHFKNKAEKFNNTETEFCLELMKEKGWLDKLIRTKI